MALALRQPARAGATATTDRVGADTRGDARVAPVSLEDVDAGRHGRGRRHVDPARGDRVRRRPAGGQPPALLVAGRGRARRRPRDLSARAHAGARGDPLRRRPRVPAPQPRSGQLVVPCRRHARGRRRDRMPGRPGAVRNDLPGQRLFAAWIHRHSGRIETADLSPARVPGCRDRRRYQLRDAAGRSSTVVEPALVATGWPRADPGRRGAIPTATSYR